MNDFDYDVVQKKRIAHGAVKKKNGSKSRKCTLPSDNLTAAERKKLNGELKVYDWSKPITWKEFKKYPHDIQEECLSHFAETWGCSSSMMAEMFGLKPQSLSQACGKMNLRGLLKHVPNTENIIRFREWLQSFQDVPTPAPVETKVVEKEVVKTINLPIFTHTIDRGYMSMSGTGNEIAQTLASIFQNTELRMRIEFELTPPEEQEVWDG